MVMQIKLDPGAFMPERAHLEDAGLDIRVPDQHATGRETDEIVCPAHGRVIIDTGVHVAIPAGYGGFLKSKSGLMAKAGILTDGTVDEGYTGSIRVIAFNHSDTDYVFTTGDKITQLVIQAVEKPKLELVSFLDESGTRGAQGFGSTGRK